MTEWHKFFKHFIKNIWIVIPVIMIFVSLASYISIYKIKPQYQASTRLFVLINSRSNINNVNEISYEDLMASQVMVKNYRELIRSRSITSQVIQKLQLTGLTDEDLAERIDVELIPDSSMLSISVVYENPELVADIANELSSVFIQKTSELLKVSNVSLVDSAVVTEKPVYPLRPFLVIAFGVLAGIVFSLGLILTFVYYDNTVNNLDEVEKKTGLRMVGIIPDMKIR